MADCRRLSVETHLGQSKIVACLDHLPLMQMALVKHLLEAEEMPALASPNFVTKWAKMPKTFCDEIDFLIFFAKFLFIFGENFVGKIRNTHLNNQIDSELSV